MPDKPAATGSGEPIAQTEYVTPRASCPECRCTFGVHLTTCSKFNMCDECRAMLHFADIHRPTCSKFKLPTPPASQSTVTLGLIRGFDNLQRWEFFYRSEQLPEGMSPRPDGKWVKYADVLALLRAAEQR